MEAEIFYFCFYLHESFTIIYEITQTKKDFKEILFSISQDIKKYTLQNYYQELQKGSVNSKFTYFLRNLLSQYENVVSKEKTIDKIK